MSSGAKHGLLSLMQRVKMYNDKVPFLYESKVSSRILFKHHPVLIFWEHQRGSAEKIKGLLITNNFLIF